MTAILLFQSYGMHRQDFFLSFVLLRSLLQSYCIQRSVPIIYISAKRFLRRILPPNTEIARCCQGLLKHLLLTKQILACLRSCFFFCFHVYSKLRPSFSIYNCIAQNFTPYRTSIHKNILQCNAYLRIRHLFHHKLINRFTCIIIIMKSVHCGKYTAV